MAKDPIEVPFEYGGHWMPGYWRYLLPKDVLEYKLPKERRATCLSCPKVHCESYDHHTRCCSYFPEVVNFLLGLALNQPESRKQVVKLNRCGFLVPMGFISTPQQWIDYLADCKEDLFGKGNRVVCPMLSKKDGLCTIYAFRNSVCSTFFCYNDHGQRGDSFWDNLLELVNQSETALAQWAMDELGFSVKAYYERINSFAGNVLGTVDPKTGGWNAKTRKKLWGKYYGRELEFYRKCGELVSKNRDRIWDIADNKELIEARKFDKAMLRSVPRKYKSEIDPTDFEDGECERPSVLLRRLKASYNTMYRLPERLVLSSRVRIAKNKKDDKQSQLYKDRPYVVEFLKRKGGNAVDWKIFVGKREAEVLKAFKRKRKLSGSLLSELKRRRIKDPSNFISEWHGQRVLEKILSE